MKIIVPSLGRAGTANSMAWLPQSNREIVFAVHADEAVAYRAAYPNTNQLILSEECRKHTGLVRKEIMTREREPFFFVDDDIRIYYKLIGTVQGIFDKLEEYIAAGASMAGLGQQLYSNLVEKDFANGDEFVRNKFVATVYGIQPQHFDTCPLERLPVYEDVALVIHAIQNGGGTIVSYCATHANKSPKTGGCNSWRNELNTIESLQTLCSIYPDICSIRETNNTTHSQNIGIGLRTAWSKIRKLS